MGIEETPPGVPSGQKEDLDQRPRSLCLELRSRRGRSGQKEGKPGKYGVMDTEERASRRREYSSVSILPKSASVHRVCNMEAVGHCGKSRYGGKRSRDGTIPIHRL